MNASEFLKSKERDTQWVAKRKAISERASQKQALFFANQQPILTDLRNVGFSYENLWEMQSSPGPYSEAILILLKHLEGDYLDATRATIARCLAVKDARQFFDFLVAAYKREPVYVEDKPSATKDGLAIAVAAAATSDKIEEIIELLKDGELGGSRILLLPPLRKRVKEDVVRAELRELVLGSALAKEIRAWKSVLE